MHKRLLFSGLWLVMRTELDPKLATDYLSFRFTFTIQRKLREHRTHQSPHQSSYYYRTPTSSRLCCRSCPGTCRCRQSQNYLACHRSTRRLYCRNRHHQRTKYRWRSWKTCCLQTLTSSHHRLRPHHPRNHCRIDRLQSPLYRTYCRHRVVYPQPRGSSEGHRQGTPW